MKRTLARFLVPAALLFAVAPLTLEARTTHATAAAVSSRGPVEGTRVVLRAIPDFLERVFVPVVPRAVSTFLVENEPVAEIIEAPAGFHLERHGGGLSISAPAGEAAGYARILIGGREVTLTLANLVPFEKIHHGSLEGYRVGSYRPAPLHGLSSYMPPRGFVRLTKPNGDLWVSDHYHLRDFQCKLDGASKFLILRTEALIKLELLQHELETKYALKFHRFTIMSGYRTPYYNARIGNETTYSRHLYGDAMDIYIDDHHTGRMEDINGDGVVDARDAMFLLRVAERLDNSEEWGWLKGGAGVYHATAAHGPYLHVDARGYIARWGISPHELGTADAVSAAGGR